jgi:DNA replication protein DnaC
MSQDTTCPHCEGTGWLLEVVDGHKTARPCGCRGSAIRQGRLAAAAIPERYRDNSLENFLDNTLSLQQAKAKAREFLDRYPFVDAGLLFVGPSGRGKTHLACAMLSELAATKGVLGLYVDFSDLLLRIQTSFRPDADQSKESVLTPIADTELLVLDELGASKPHPWVQDVLYNLLNTRYNKKKITIATSNFEDEPDPMSGEKERLEDRLGYRIRSRLYEMCVVVPLRGADFRKTSSRAHIQSRF